MRLVWDVNAWEDYLRWQNQDRKILKRINQLTQDVRRNGNEGIGKPGPLKHDFAGYWSRRITDEHRLVYKVTDTEVRIAACRYRYGRGGKACRCLPRRDSTQQVGAPVSSTAARGVLHLSAFDLVSPS